MNMTLLIISILSILLNLYVLLIVLIVRSHDHKAIARLMVDFTEDKLKQHRERSSHDIKMLKELEDARRIIRKKQQELSLLQTGRDTHFEVGNS